MRSRPRRRKELTPHHPQPSTPSRLISIKEKLLVWKQRLPRPEIIQLCVERSSP